MTFESIWKECSNSISVRKAVSGKVFWSSKFFLHSWLLKDIDFVAKRGACAVDDRPRFTLRPSISPTPPTPFDRLTAGPPAKNTMFAMHWALNRGCGHSRWPPKLSVWSPDWCRVCVRYFTSLILDYCSISLDFYFGRFFLQKSEYRLSFLHSFVRVSTSRTWATCVNKPRVLLCQLL